MGPAGEAVPPVLRRAGAAAIGVGLLAAAAALPLGAYLALWYGFLLVQMLLFRRTLALGLLFVAATLYATTAWLVLSIGGVEFAPWPSRSLVAGTTAVDLTAVVLAYVLAEVVLGAERVQAAVGGAAATLRRRYDGDGGTGADFAASVVLLAVGGADMIRILTLGIGTVLGGSRREFAEQLLLGGNHNVQVLVVAATIRVVSRAVVGRGRALGVALTALAWGPFLLAGSRKEAIVTAVILLVLWFRSMRVWQRLLLGGAAMLAFVSPALRTGRPIDVLHEFVLPQYMHFAIAMGLVPHDLGGSFAERALFLIPSMVRPIGIEDFGQAFAALGVTGVGVGASPFGEAALNGFWGSVPWSFAVVMLAALAVPVLCARRLPTIAVVGFGLLTVYGRSDFWTTMFFVIAIGLVLALLSPDPAGPRWRATRAIAREVRQGAYR